METRCPQCDTGIMLDFRFCPSCGIGLSTGTEMPIIDRRLLLALRRSRWRKLMIWGLVTIAVSFLTFILPAINVPGRWGIHKFIESMDRTVGVVLAMATTGLLLIGMFFFCLGFGFTLLEYGRPHKQKSR